MKSRTTINTPIGFLELESTNGTLTGVTMLDEHTAPASGAGVGFEQVVEQIDEYFAGKRETFELPMRAAGNEFQMRVWDALKDIPFGETRSYGEIAEQLGDKTLARAVGAACHANPLPIVVPCHRVIGSDGALVGFGGGLERKQYLLHHENPAAFPIALKLF